MRVVIRLHRLVHRHVEPVGVGLARHRADVRAGQQTGAVNSV
jgi:hypothetical protein